MQNKILAYINMDDLKQHLQVLAEDAYNKKLIYGTSYKKYVSLIDSKKKVRKSTIENEINKLSHLLTSKPKEIKFKSKSDNHQVFHKNKINHLGDIGNFQKVEKNNGKVCVFKLQLYTSVKQEDHDL